MNYQIIGAICVIAACGCFGFLLAAHYIQHIRLVRQLIWALDYMECELQYRNTALADLCREASWQCTGQIRVLLRLSEELEAQVFPDVSICMASALARSGNFPRDIQQILHKLGQILGKFDLTGQLKELDIVRKECRDVLQELLADKDTRIRSYQTLGLCTGAAIAILFV